LFLAMQKAEYSLSAIKRISSDLKEMQRFPVEGVAVLPAEDDMGRWSVFMEGPKGTPFEGGIYELELVFAKNYPEAPPTLRFVSQFWHPNVYRDGPVCISMLHAAGDDQISGESFDIRWKPINSVSSVLNSVLLMLMEPNLSSPANVDASVMWRDDLAAFKSRAKVLAQRAQDKFMELHSDVWIPHPDTNPEERLMYHSMHDDEKRLAPVEVWGDSDNDEEWGSGEEMHSSD
jgi:ubiquitin-protein ligase